MLLRLLLLPRYFGFGWWGLRKLRAAATTTIYLEFLGLGLLLAFTNLGEGMVGAVSLALLLLLLEPAFFILLLCQGDYLASKSGHWPLVKIGRLVSSTWSECRIRIFPKDRGWS